MKKSAETREVSPPGGVVGSAAEAQDTLQQQMVAALVRLAMILAPTDPARRRAFDAGEDGTAMLALAVHGLCAALGMDELVLTAGDVALVDRLAARLEAHHHATASSVH